METDRPIEFTYLPITANSSGMPPRAAAPGPANREGDYAPGAFPGATPPPRPMECHIVSYNLDKPEHPLTQLPGPGMRGLLGGGDHHCPYRDAAVARGDGGGEVRGACRSLCRFIQAAIPSRDRAGRSDAARCGRERA